MTSAAAEPGRVRSTTGQDEIASSGAAAATSAPSSATIAVIRSLPGSRLPITTGVPAAASDRASVDPTGPAPRTATGTSVPSLQRSPYDMRSSLLLVRLLEFKQPNQELITSADPWTIGGCAN